MRRHRHFVPVPDQLLQPAAERFPLHDRSVPGNEDLRVELHQALNRFVSGIPVGCEVNRRASHFFILDQYPVHRILLHGNYGVC